MTKFKPMLARDWIESKVITPAILQPKVDGVRGLNETGGLLARSLKQHANKFLTEMFSHKEFIGFDGEIVVGDDWTHPDLCRITSGACRRQGEHDFKWLLFDIYHDTMTGQERQDELRRRWDKLPKELQGITQVLPYKICNSVDAINQADSEHLDLRYEGSIIRNPNAPYKMGRSDSKMQVWRIKRFIDAEFLITGIIEGQHNANEAKTNELGRTERSTHQENMVPNGLVGSFTGILLADVVDPSTGIVILLKGAEITVSAGNLDAKQRKEYFENQSLVLNQIGKFKLFPKGTKDKPRFPTFICLRSQEDMSE